MIESNVTNNSSGIHSNVNVTGGGGGSGDGAFIIDLGAFTSGTVAGAFNTAKERKPLLFNFKSTYSSSAYHIYNIYEDDEDPNESYVKGWIIYRGEVDSAVYTDFIIKGDDSIQLNFNDEKYLEISSKPFHGDDLLFDLDEDYGGTMIAGDDYDLRYPIDGYSRLIFIVETESKDYFTVYEVPVNVITEYTNYNYSITGYKERYIWITFNSELDKFTTRSVAAPGELNNNTPLIKYIIGVY